VVETHKQRAGKRAGAGRKPATTDPAPVQSTITDRVRDALRECGKSQDDLARLAKCTQPAVSQFLAGAQPHADTLERLARAAGYRLTLTAIRRSKRQ
jgi:predicted transcriptional regulator